MQNIVVRAGILLLIMAASARAEPGPLLHDFPETLAHFQNHLSISFHPDGQHLLATHCTRPGEPPACDVTRLDLRGGRALLFRFPSHYVYRSAAYSPDGRYIALTRVSAEQKAETALGNNQIVLMDSDGRHARVLVTDPGYKSHPTLSPDNSRLAYWKGTLRAPGSKTLASSFDLWELDIASGRSSPFCTPQHFFQSGPLQYLTRDEILANADTPMAALDSSDAVFAFGPKYRHSMVYQLHRGMSVHAVPEVWNVDSARDAAVTRSGNVLFFGQRNGPALFLQEPDGKQTRLPIPDAGAASSILLGAADPSGTWLAFIYSPQDQPPRAHAYAIGLVHIPTQRWFSLDVPPENEMDKVDVSIPD